MWLERIGLGGLAPLVLGGVMVVWENKRRQTMTATVECQKGLGSAQLDVEYNSRQDLSDDRRVARRVFRTDHLLGNITW